MSENSLIDARPVDVALLYGMGQKDRAQYVARLLHGTVHIEVSEGWTETEINALENTLEKRSFRGESDE